jgi:flagellar biogenesis protein FliO
MKSMPKWLLVPPAVALLLLGPLSMQGGSAAASKPLAAEAPPAAPPAAAEADPARTVRTPQVPRTPDLWQMGSALVGVLLLGVGGVMLLRKLRGGATPTRGSTLATLRQTLRLSARQAIHAIEFDDRILLVGEHERGLVLIESGRLPDRAADEATVFARHGGAGTAGPGAPEDGAVPKDLVIPRPDNPGRPRLPTPPVMPAPARQFGGLNDFRALLQKAGRA